MQLTARECNVDFICCICRS